MKYFYLILSLIGLILLGMLAFKATPTATFGDAGIPNSLTSPTNTSIALTTNTSTLVLAANSGRLYASICSVPTNTTSTFLVVSSAKNASGTTVGVAATLNNGIYLATGTCYTINNSNLLVGIVNAFANASNTLSLLYQ